MSGKFDIGDDFNVFDEWGNNVGKFTPTGVGLENGCLMIVTLIIAWTLGFFIYALFRLIGKGFQEVGRGDWGKAMMYWAVPGLLAGGVCFSIFSVMVASAAQQYQHQLIQQQAQRDVQELANNPPIDLKAWKGKCTSDHNDCPWGDEPTYLFIEIKNRYDKPIKVRLLDYFCNKFVMDTIAPGETGSFACVGKKKSQIDQMDEFCTEISYQLSNQDPMYYLYPKSRLCSELR